METTEQKNNMKDLVWASEWENLQDLQGAKFENWQYKHSSPTPVRHKRRVGIRD